jgi:CD36 family
VTFSEDGNVVSYVLCQGWHYNAEVSERNGCTGCNPDTDVIHNLNPGYFGAIANAGGELALTQAMTGPAMRRIFDFLETRFVQDTVARHSALSLPERKASLTVDGDSDAFYATWANATVLPSANWTGMLVSAGAPEPSGIGLDSARHLFDALRESSLTNADADSYSLWSEAVALRGDARANARNLAHIEVSFALSARQAQMVLDWLAAGYWPTSVEPALRERYGVERTTQLAYVQWGEASVSPDGKSVAELYPGEHFASKPEFALWSRHAATMTAADAEKLWDGSIGLFVALNWAVFAEYAAPPPNLEKLAAVWGIESKAQLTFLELYFANAADKFGQPMMVELARAGGALMAHRSPNEWAWHAVDPLLVVLQPESADVALQGNDTSPDACLAARPPDYFLTGANDTALVGQELTFDGMAEFPSSWYAFTYHVHGSNSDGQFVPQMEPDTDLYVFDNNFMRTLKATHIANTTIRDVKVYKFWLSPENFDVPQPDFYMRDGFQGFCNLTGPQQGAPIFLSQAHMYGADSRWPSQVIGQNAPDVDVDPTYILIEPYSGKAVATNQALQLNIYVPPQPNWFALSPLGNANMRADTMFPIAIIRQESALSSENADQVHDQLYFGIYVRKIFFGVLFGLGLALFGSTVFLIWLAYRRHRVLDDNGYELIENDDEPMHSAPYSSQPIRRHRRRDSSSAHSSDEPSSSDDDSEIIDDRRRRAGGIEIDNDYDIEYDHDIPVSSPSSYY